MPVIYIINWEIQIPGKLPVRLFFGRKSNGQVKTVIILVAVSITVGIDRDDLAPYQGPACGKGDRGSCGIYPVGWDIPAFGKLHIHHYRYTVWFVIRCGISIAVIDPGNNPERTGIGVADPSADYLFIQPHHELRSVWITPPGPDLAFQRIYKQKLRKILEIDDILHPLIIYFRGSFDGILSEVPEISQCDLVSDLWFDVWTCREPDIKRRSGRGVLGKLKILVCSGITGLDRGFFVEIIEQAKPWLKANVCVIYHPGFINSWINGNIIRGIMIHSSRACVLEHWNPQADFCSEMPA